MTPTHLNSLEIQILIRLVSGSKTVEELQRSLYSNYSDLMLAVKTLVIKRKIERKDGYPTRYALSDSALLLAKKLRAKHDMSDLMLDPCTVTVPVMKE